MATKKVDKELVEKSKEVLERASNELDEQFKSNILKKGGFECVIGVEDLIPFNIPKKIYKIITLKGTTLNGLNCELQEFKGTIVEVLSYTENYGVYELVALCYI
jgi:hypothetical protein